MKTSKLFFLIFSLFVLSVSCSNDDDNTQEPDNDEEVITTVQVNLTDQNNVTSSFSYKVEDGVVERDQIALSINSVYTVSLEFLNESETPTEVVTTEISEEGDEHLICYSAISNSLSITVTDVDENNLELGLESRWNTLSAASGDLSITLKHQPDIKASPVNCALGESDIVANFEFVIN